MESGSIFSGLLVSAGFTEKQVGDKVVLDNPEKEIMRQAFLGGAIAFDQSRRGKIEVHGPEAAMFLHNLCTNDITGMPIGGGCEAFFATRRARPVAWANIFHVLLSRGRQGFWVDLPDGAEETLLRHLDQHLISEQVEFSDRTGDFCQLHLTGPEAERALSKAIGSAIPALEPWQHMERTIGPSNCHIRRVDWVGAKGFDVAFLEHNCSSIYKILLDLGVSFGDHGFWQGLRVMAGLPEMGLEITEQVFIPELGRNKFAICHTKGCYLGQEPIVMARDRGQINRKLVLLESLSSIPVSGMTIHHNGKEAGVVTSASQSLSGKPIALGFLRRECWDHEGFLTLKTVDFETPAKILPWPLN